MGKLIKKIKENFFNSEFDFRIRLFNILALGGIAVSFFTLIASLIAQMWWTAILCSILLVVAFGLVIFTQKTHMFTIAYYLTVVIIFLILLPILFFTSGGHRSGTPSIFLFAVIFTILMLKGKNALIVSL